jgi:hypothetical protein
MEFLILVGVFVVAFSWGWSMHASYVRYNNEKLAEMLTQIREVEDENLIRIIIEKHNDTFFVYSKEDSKFIAQANSKEELEDKLRELFPGKRFGASPENLKEIGFYHDAV